MDEQTALNMTDQSQLGNSISKLLHELCSQNNPAMLQSVIDELLAQQQARFNEQAAALRGIISQLASGFGSRSSDPDLQQHLKLLTDCAQAAHPTETLAALVGRLPAAAIETAVSAQTATGPHTTDRDPATNPLQHRLLDIRSQLESSSSLIQLLLTDIEKQISADNPGAMRAALNNSLRRQLDENNVMLANLDRAIALAANASATPVIQPEVQTDATQTAAAETGEAKPFSLAPTTEPVTGLPDRAALALEFRREAGRADRHETTFSLALLEIDDLELLRRNKGDGAADQVIQFYINDVFRQTRIYDYLARLSEGHFALLLPQTEIYAAETIIGRMLEKVRFSQRMLKHAGKEGSLPGFRAGLAAFSREDTFEKLFARCEQALLQTGATDQQPVSMIKNL